MRTHILIAFIALVVSACASKEGRELATSPAEQQRNIDQAQHAQMIDGQASRIR